MITVLTRNVVFKTKETMDLDCLISFDELSIRSNSKTVNRRIMLCLK